MNISNLITNLSNILGSNTQHNPQNGTFAAENSFSQQVNQSNMQNDTYAANLSSNNNSSTFPELLDEKYLSHLKQPSIAQSYFSQSIYPMSIPSNNYQSTENSYKQNNNQGNQSKPYSFNANQNLNNNSINTNAQNSGNLFSGLNNLFGSNFDINKITQLITAIAPLLGNSNPLSSLFNKKNNSTTAQEITENKRKSIDEYLD